MQIDWPNFPKNAFFFFFFSFSAKYVFADINLKYRLIANCLYKKQLLRYKLKKKKKKNLREIRLYQRQLSRVFVCISVK
jgi:hypothetical protein